MKEQPIRKKQPIKKTLTPRKEGSGSLAMGTEARFLIYLLAQLQILEARRN